MKRQTVSVGAFIPREDGKVLIAQRAADEVFLENHWEYVSGGVEFGENPIEALMREVKEEAGLAIKPIRPYGLFDFLINEDWHNIEVSFLCGTVPDETEIVLSDEHQDFTWIVEEELNEINPMTPEMRERIRKGFVVLEFERDR